jgi:hypothetical protein
MRCLSSQARLFALAEHDEAIAIQFLAKLGAPPVQTFAAHCSERVALAGRVMIEQSDLIIAVWDGATTSFIGGTGHTIAAALDLGAAVVWIDARTPEDWTLLRTPESLAVRAARCRVFPPCANPAATRRGAPAWPLAQRVRYCLARILCAPGFTGDEIATRGGDAGLFAGSPDGAA